MTKIAALAVVILLAMSPCSAQTFGFAAFEVDLSSASENPPIVQSQGTGRGLVLIHMERDGDGNLRSAVVDFTADIFLANGETVTAFHIHRGARGANGPVVVDPRFTRTEFAAGRHTLFRQVSVTDATGLATIEAILANPAGYYFNIHTVTAPGGLLRGQLAPATLGVVSQNSARLGTLLSENQSLRTEVQALRAEVKSTRELLQRIAFRLGIVTSPTP